MKRFLKLAPWLAFFIAALAAVEIILLKVFPELEFPHEIYSSLALGVISAFLGILTHSYVVSKEEESQHNQKIDEILSELLRRNREVPIAEISSTEIQEAGRDFAERCDGEMYWFNVPLGRCIPPHFAEFLQPAIQNSRVTSIVFILDNKVKNTWNTIVKPRIEDVEKSNGLKTSKVRVRFHNLRKAGQIGHVLAFKMINVKSRRAKPEAHVFFHDETWMESINIAGRQEFEPRRMIKVGSGSQLFSDLISLIERYSHY